MIEIRILIAEVAPGETKIAVYDRAEGIHEREAEFRDKVIAFMDELIDGSITGGGTVIRKEFPKPE